MTDGGERAGTGGAATARPRPLGTRREAFELPDDVAYFNTANLAPQLRTVREAGERALDRRAAPWEIKSDDWFTEVEVLRDLAAQVMGADADGVALVPASSYGIAVAARNLPVEAGRRILVLAGEYPSGIYTWRAVCRRTGAEILTVSREPGQAWADAVRAQIDDRVAIVSVPNVHWTDGSWVDLDAVADAARRVGAALVIDASQSLGAVPMDVARLRPDFLVSGGYKWLLGPFSVGYLYVAERHRDGVPLEENWIVRAGSEDFARLLDYRDEYQPGARRFDVGQRTNFTLTPMAIAALTQVLEWGVPRIAASLELVTERLAAEAGALGLTPLPAALRGPHVLGISLPEPALAAVGGVLAGARCYAGVRGSSLRLAPHLFTTGRDIERLFGALARVPGVA